MIFIILQISLAKTYLNTDFTISDITGENGNIAHYHQC